MNSLATILPWLLQSCSAADFAAESLLKYSNAQNTVWRRELWGEEGVDERDLWEDKVVGPSQKHEQYLPAPPGFLRNSRAAFQNGNSKTENSKSGGEEKYQFGLKDSSLATRPRGARQHDLVRYIFFTVNILRNHKLETGM